MVCEAMHSSTVNEDYVSVSPRQDDLQREIEEKQRELTKLYERRRHARAVRLPQHNLEEVAETKDVPQLRIRGSPAHRRQPRPAAPSTPPLGSKRPPESIIVITFERRRLHPGPILHNCGSCTAAIATQSMPTQNRPSPSREFATRLSRLHKASMLVPATVSEATAAATTQDSLSDSLAVSPIATDIPDGQAYASAASYLSGISALFEGCGVVSCVGGGEVEGGRHVRFSSRSPQVATFSVERSCAPHEEGSTATAGAVIAATAGPTTGVEKLTPGSELDLVQKTHPRITSPWVSTLIMRPSRPSRDTPLLLPQTSVTSYLAPLEELRSSLLQEPPDTLHNVPSSVADTCYSVQPLRNQKTRETPSVMNARRVKEEEEEDKEAVSTPLKLRALEYSCGLGESVGAAAVGISSTAVSGALGLSAPLTEGSPFTAATPVSSGVFRESSPIFLRRPARRHELSARDSCPPPFSNITNQLEQTSAQPSPRPRESGKRSSASGSKTAKKCVRFRESVERTDTGAAGAPCKRSRPGRRLAHSPASPPVLAGVPIMMPVKLCCEQEGFGASILLACGPTLYFD